MLSKPSLLYAAARVAIFILLPLLITLMMFVHISYEIRGIMENETAENAAFQSALISKQINENLSYLQIISEYFSDGRVEEQNMEAVLSNLVSPDQLSRSGILRFDETAVCGRALRAKDYTAVRKSFRGKKAVMYRKNEGFLFTVPIYNKKNIKYVLYQFFDEKELFGPVIIDCYEGRAQFAIADRDQHSAASFSGSSDISFFFDDEFQDVVKELDRRMGLDTSAAVYSEKDGEKALYFVSLTGFNGLFLVGRVPYSAAMGSVETLIIIVIVVTILMLVLLSIGTMNIVAAGEKIRESDELRKAKAAAEEANKSKGAFIANMSHELRTPINVILGMNEMILREETSPTAKERAMDIKGAAQILLSLINDVLDYSKIESGKMNIICAEYSLVTMIRDLTLLTENRAHQKSIGFVLDIDPELPVGLYGDDIRIRQVLTNLLTNAVKYTAEGIVTLKISGKRENSDNITLHCEVRDTGSGIKEEDIGNLLVPFMRIDEKRNRNVEGTGLGMPIIVNLLKLMGSDLKVESVYGEGSTFWFDIDQKIVDSEPVGDIRKRMGDMAKEYNYKVSFVAPKARVLMVDDNSMNRQIFESLLSKTKISITSVSSGMKCLEAVQKEHFDIIFMDYLMPEMNGVETLNAMRSLENNMCKDSPVVALTANAFSGDREKYMSYGFDDFLSKPIITEKLEALIMKLLPQEYVSTTTEEEEPEAPESGDELPEIEGINNGIAKMYLKENSIVLSSLESYYDRLETDLRELPDIYLNIDGDSGLADYRIRVHALKSSSAMVGSMTVSELSKVLEYAARDGERDKIRAVHPILMEIMAEMLERLSRFKPREDEKPRAEDTGVLLKQLEELRGLMEQMNVEEAEAAAERIQEYSYSEELREIINNICDDISFMDYDSAKEKTDSAINIIRNAL